MKTGDPVEVEHVWLSPSWTILHIWCGGFKFVKQDKDEAIVEIDKPGAFNHGCVVRLNMGNVRPMES